MWSRAVVVGTPDGQFGPCLGQRREQSFIQQLGLMAQALQEIGYTSEPVPFRFLAWKNR
jgi:hypothetical protein